MHGRAREEILKTLLSLHIMKMKTKMKSASGKTYAAKGSIVGCVYQAETVVVVVVVSVSVGQLLVALYHANC